MNESHEASVHALAGAYAIDALDDAERTEFEEHLAACGHCQAEAASLHETAAVLGGARALEPPDSVRRNVLAGIATSGPQESRSEPAPPSTPVDTPVGAPDPSRAARDDEPAGRAIPFDRRRRFRFAAAAVAAAVIAAIGVGTVVVNQADDDAPIAAQPTLAERVQEADDAQEVAVELDGGAKATVYRSASMNRAVVVTENMPPPPEGMVYELWLDDREKGYTPAGLMSTTSDQTLVLQGDAARATQVGITVEPAQGSRVPTSEPIVVFPFDSEPA